LKHLMIILTLAVLCSAVVGQAEELSRRQQIDIIESYLYVTGQSRDVPDAAVAAGHQAVGDEVPLKCGTPAIHTFLTNYDQLDKDLLEAYKVALPARPTDLGEFLDSDSGWFKIHYTTTGGAAVYESWRDENPANGVPDFVDAVAEIMDDVHHHHVTELGYPVPVSDGPYNGGGDDKYDIYLVDFSSNVYGETYLDSIMPVGGQVASSWIKMDNDYDHISLYSDRPLDAIRVTAAHEYFHAIHFALDIYEKPPGLLGSPWMEMSAVWMEEETYDDINDYYNYLPFYFNDPGKSLQQFGSSGDLHPYGSGIWPIFLAENFGRDIVRDIWQRCADSIGSNFVASMDTAIQVASGGAHDLASAFGKFALYNYFTNTRYSLGPDSLRYEEGNDYPAIASNKIAQYDRYGSPIYPNSNPFSPEVMGVSYAQFSRFDRLAWDTTYWVCYDGLFPSCGDSAEITDTTTPGLDTTFYIDSTMLLNHILDIELAPWLRWGSGLVYRPEATPSEVEIDMFHIPVGTGAVAYPYENPRLYQSIMVASAPVPFDDRLYFVTDPHSMPVWLGWFINDESEAFYVDPDSLGKNFSVISYPNPFGPDLSDGTEMTIGFRLDIGTLPGNPDDPMQWDLSAYLKLDIFNLAGEYVWGTGSEVIAESYVDPDGTDQYWYQTTWDTSNLGDELVTSGVYFIKGQLYRTSSQSDLIIEGTGKVAIIR